MKKLTIIILCLSLYSSSLLAKNFKYGKISKEEMELQTCPYEKDAVAVFLYDSRVTDISYSNIKYYYHVRIKILKEEGLKYATIKLPFYRKDGIENITSVKAHTINFDKNGKKEITDLSRDAIYTVDANENYGEVRFSLPNVKVGSIIEYKYTNNSTFFSYLDTWYFQSDIPVLYSVLHVNMPESLKYNLIMFGDQLSAKYGNISSKEWVLENMPSIKKESFINNYLDYVEQIRFQLSGYYTRDKSSIGGSLIYKDSMTTWKDLAKEYLEKIHFLERRGFARKQLENLLDGSENNWEKIEKIYDFVKDRVKWDEKYRLFPKKSPQKVLEEKIASDSEINYLLVLLLREAGINCNPALARTNNRGLIQKDYPLLSQFNHVMAEVELYNKKFFLDATSAYRPYDLLAEKDLNYQAYVLDKTKPQWVVIKPYSKNSQSLYLNYDFSDLSKPVCNMKVQETGYYAANSRQKISEDGIENWVKRIIDPERYSVDYDSIQIQNANALDKALLISGKMDMDIDWEDDSDISYFSPFPEKIIQNPFVAETRQYRIDYNYKRANSIHIKIQLPENYTFEDYPKSKTVKLPYDSGKFELMTQLSGNILQIRTTFKLNNTSFPKEYYSNLKELYVQMNKMLRSQIVIKKTTNLSINE
ncbi:DUF3857 and transglutaminase domain-containing protein [Ancylomarina longa]|nr:DUF3857 and transglutaminase domain-containing protein [Ancylomarina longa]